MKIMLLNAWGGKLYDQLIPYIATTDPDVLCLQEVTRTPNTDVKWLVYEDYNQNLVQRANLFQEVSDALPSHRAIFCPAARGNLYDEGIGIRSEWGLATYVRRDYPIIGQAQDFVHGEFEAADWGEHPRPRNAHVLRLFDDATDSVVTIAHMHGLRDPAGKGDTPARDAQAQRFAGLIKRMKRDGDKVVACGDFNVIPTSATFSPLRELGLTDLITTYNHTDTRTSFYAKTPRYADYMLVSANISVRLFDVVREPEVSDHRALCLTFL